MDGFILGRAIETAFKEKRLAEAFDAIVERYYEEYTDAVSLDPQFYSYLQLIFDTCFTSGETPDGREFDEVVKRRT